MDYIGPNNWVNEFFIDKGHLVLRVLDARWKDAWNVVDDLVEFLRSYGVGKWSRLLDLGCGNGSLYSACLSRL